MGTLPEDFPFYRLTHIPIDSNRGVCTMPWGTEIELKPFFGIMGVAAAAGVGPVQLGRAARVRRQHRQ